MQVVFAPQRSDMHVGYTFAGSTVIAAIGDVSEGFDFSEVPDGEITEIDQGSLPSPAVLRAIRVAGQLTVVLLLTHDHVDRAPRETRFPENPYTVAEAEALLIARNAALEAEDA